MKAAWLCAVLTLSAGPCLAQMTLTSPDIAPGGTLPAKYVGPACGGQDLSPPLAWSGAPAGTRSFALTVYDPDAPTGSGWWQWVVFNIPATTDHLAAGASTAPGGMPRGSVQSMNDNGHLRYGGACPPEGAPPHHYVFTIRALNVESLPLTASASGAKVGLYIIRSTLAEASLTALYGH
jgi:Raf kinase inhibitor-like YbhB/YbcL family protein